MTLRASGKSDVCIITTAHDPFDVRIFIKEAKTLAQSGFKVTLIAPYDKTEERDGVLVIGFPKAKGRIRRLLFSAATALRLAVQQDADIYHVHDPELIWVALALHILFPDKKILYDSHEDVPRQVLSNPHFPKFLRRPISILFEAIENFVSRRISAVIVATPFIEERFKQVNQKTITINNFPLLSEFLSPDASWSKKTRKICYVGIITKQRSLLEIIDALPLADVHLLLAGRFSPPELRDEAVPKEGWKRVEELGQVQRSQLPAVFRQSMAGIVLDHPEPNSIHSMPNKMFEYMSAGLPLIASNFPLWKSIVEGKHCGLCVDPTDPKSIAQAVRWIVEHPAEAKEMGQNGINAVQSTYNWETEGKKLIDFYDGLFNGGPN